MCIYFQKKKLLSYNNKEDIPMQSLCELLILNICTVILHNKYVLPLHHGRYKLGCNILQVHYSPINHCSKDSIILSFNHINKIPMSVSGTQPMNNFVSVSGRAKILCWCKQVTYARAFLPTYISQYSHAFYA